MTPEANPADDDCVEVVRSGSPALPIGIVRPLAEQPSGEGLTMRSVLLLFLVAGVVAAQSVPPRKDIPAIAKAAKGAIVSIIMSDKDGHAIAQGTGFLISKDGRIVTNYHVIENGSSAIVKLPDGAFLCCRWSARIRQSPRCCCHQGARRKLPGAHSRKFRPNPSGRGSRGDWQSAFSRIDRFKRHSQRNPNSRGERRQILAGHDADFTRQQRRPVVQHGRRGGWNHDLVS